MTVDHLRRAAALLRNPYLANWDHAVAHALADWLDLHARSEDAAREAERHVGVEPYAISTKHAEAGYVVARALLWSFGHTCGVRPDEPCSSRELHVPTPEEAP